MENYSASGREIMTMGRNVRVVSALDRIFSTPGDEEYRASGLLTRGSRGGKAGIADWQWLVQASVCR